MLLGEDLLRNSSLVKGKNVLELGSGVGALGLVAKHCGASCVTLTDFELDSVELMRRTAAHEACGDGGVARADDGASGNGLRVRFCDWDTALQREAGSKHRCEASHPQEEDCALSVPSLAPTDIFEVRYAMYVC